MKISWNNFELGSSSIFIIIDESGISDKYRLNLNRKSVGMLFLSCLITAVR